MTVLKRVAAGPTKGTYPLPVLLHYVSIFNGPVHTFLLTHSTVTLKVASTDLETKSGSRFITPGQQTYSQNSINLSGYPSFMA